MLKTFKKQSNSNYILHKGIVIKSTGSWYQVRLENDKVLQCRIIGKFRLNGQKVTNPVAVGDEVMVELEGEDNGTIKEILPRRNCVVRQSPRKKHHLHIMASNIDQAVLIMTIINPNLKQGFIDRFLIMTEAYDIPVSIVFNKSDTYGEEELAVYELLKDIYEKIGYQIFLVSALEGKGIDPLKALLKDKTSLISGQSGVGKSTLINAIESSLDIRTEEISDYSGKGTHTTTFAQMYPLSNGGRIIDTPGIKLLSFNNLEVMDVAHNFREFFKASKNCKFANCMHRNEPGCAVKEGIESEEISDLRYINYIQMIEEIEDQNYWERHQM